MWFSKKKAKKNKANVLSVEDGFPVLSGVRYEEFLEQYHSNRSPARYLEVGTQTGKSLTFAKGDCISVDPEFKLRHEVIGAKSSLYHYQGTSDDFFASGYLGKVGFEVEFAFLDGMHLFEYLLRDFMNTEAASSRSGVIAMHDCVPFNRKMATRDWDKAITKSWTGDVWKLILILRQYRPDLLVEVIDCPPTALTFVSRLDPGSLVLREAYDEIIDAYMEMSLCSFGVERFVDNLDLVDSRSYFTSAGGA